MADLGSTQLSVRLFRLARALAARAPLPFGYWLAGLIGGLYYHLNPGHSRHAVANMAVVLAQHPGAPSARRLARRGFAYYAMCLLDFLRLPVHPVTRPEDLIPANLTVDGWHHLEAALGRGRGIILVAAHFGNWDQAAPLFAARGHQVTIVVDEFVSPGLNAEVQGARAALGHHLVAATDGAALRRLYVALRRNEILGLLIDRPLRHKGARVSFFGREAYLPGGAATLALRTGATVLHAYVVRRPDLVSNHLVIEPPVAAPITGDRAEDERALMQAIVDRLQRLIQRHPEQWYMFRPMWAEARAARTGMHAEEPLISTTVHDTI